MEKEQKKWWVVVRKDNHYPLLVYAEEKRAKDVAKENGELVVPVVEVKS